jgi:hypothetical protein
VEDLAKIFKELVEQKKKYFEKILSIDAEDTLVWRFLSTYDLAMGLSSTIIPEFFYSSLSLALTFDFDLYELEPLNLEFEWRFPDIEEWLRGVNIVIDRIVPWWGIDLEEFLRGNIKEEYLESIEATRPRKCYWGESRYGECYVDPAAVREFLRSAIAMVFKKNPSVIDRKLLLESKASALNISHELVRFVYDRLAMIMDTHKACFVLDYGTLDISMLCEQYYVVPEWGKTRYVNIDNNVVEIGLRTLADAALGCVTDASSINFCFLLPDEDIFMHSPESYVEALNEKLRRFRDRYMLTPLALTNYETGEEAADYTKNERLEIWGNLMSLRYGIEAMVKNWLDNNVPNLDVFTRRKYVTAVLQLFGHLGKRHRWGYKIFKLMSDEELKSWWIDYWVQQGLDRDVLEKLWSFIAPLLPSIVEEKVELGRKPRKKRLGNVVS